MMSTSTRATNATVARPTLRSTTQQYHMLSHNTLLPHRAHTAALHYSQLQHNNDTLNNGYKLQTLLHALAKANGMMKRLWLIAIKNCDH